MNSCNTSNHFIWWPQFFLIVSQERLQNNEKKVVILGIETSCDETAASIIQENDTEKPNI